MGLGDAYTSSTALSVSKLNTTNVIWGTGAYLAGLDKSKHKVVVCTATGSGLTVDHIYLADSTATTWLDFGGISDHNHTGAGEGGTLVSVLGDNSGVIDLLLSKTQDLDRANWIQTTTSTGTIENFTDGTTGERAIRLRPNGTSGSEAQISYPHLKLDFGEDSNYQVKVQIETATNSAFHTGVGADDITAADSNTRKYQIEYCTTTNNNWWLRTANGSANSASDTGVAITTARTGLNLAHYPDLGTPKVDFWMASGLVLTKTSNIPTSSATADINLIKHSIKNSTGADRPVKIFATRLIYKINDAWVT